MSDPLSDAKAELQRAVIAESLHALADDAALLPVDKGSEYFAPLVAQLEALRAVLRALRHGGL